MVKKSLLLLFVLLFGCGSLLRAQDLVYDFEAETEAEGPQGWTFIDADGDGHTWRWLGYGVNYSYESAHEGIGLMSSDSYNGSWGGALTPDNFMVSPEKLAYGSINFWAGAQDESWAAEHFSVEVSTTGNTDAADFTTIQEWTMTSKSSGKMSQGRNGRGTRGAYYNYNVDFSAYAGQEIWVAIRHFDCTDMFRLNVDDVTLAMPDNTVVIDFETGDFSQYEFTNDATYPWTVVEEDGTHYAKSGNGGVNSSTSTLTCSHEFASDGYIYFDFAAYGEGSDTYDWDKCRFFIDGAQVFDYGNHDMWESLLQTVTAGTHTFTWTYKKDSSVNPTGDYFAIDNITFAEGDPCVAPATLSAAGGAGGATITWGGEAASFTVGYKAVSATTWTEVSGIEGHTYTITGIEAGNYDVRVMADCDPGNYATGSFTAFGPNATTANWYGYATYASGSSDGNFVAFSMSNLSAVSTVLNPGGDLYAADYANGYVWFITTGGALYKAALDNEAQTIAVPMQVVAGMESETATEMSYNPVDGMMYYISAGDASMLKKFDPANPGAGATTVGTLADHLYAFAINGEGVAYGMQGTGDLYTVNLTNASVTLVGSTGVQCAYVQTMAFDRETNELFWAQILDGSTYGMYRVDPTTASALNLGTVADVLEFTGLFGVYGSTVSENITDVMLNGFVAPTYGGHPSFGITAASSAYTVQSVNWYHGDAVMTATDTFDEEGADYYMVVTVAPADGYNFAETVSVYFNGNLSIYDPANSEIVGGVLHASTIAFQVYNTSVYTFDNNTTEGWTEIDADGDGFTWVLGSQCDGIYLNGGSLAGSGHNESADLMTSGSYSNVYGVLTPDNYLVTPNKANYTFISFYACAQDASYAAEHFGVALSLASNTNPSDFIMLDEWTMTSKRSNVNTEGRGGQTRQGTWYEYTVNLSEYAGQEFWLAIRHYNCSDMFLLNVDDIEVAVGDAVPEYTADFMSIYPNPAKDKVMIASDVTVNEYRIYDVTGAEIMSNQVNSETFEVNVSAMPAGVYYIRIYADGLIQSKKFIVE